MNSNAQKVRKGRAQVKNSFFSLAALIIALAAPTLLNLLSIGLLSCLSVVP